MVKAHKEAEAAKYIHTFKEGELTIEVINGRYGPYITDGTKNVRVPKDRDPKTLTLDECKEMIEKAPAKKTRAKKTTTKKAAEKKTTAKKTTAKKTAAKKPAAKKTTAKAATKATSKTATKTAAKKTTTKKATKSDAGDES